MMYNAQTKDQIVAKRWDYERVRFQLTCDMTYEARVLRVLDVGGVYDFDEIWTFADENSIGFDSLLLTMWRHRICSMESTSTTVPL